MIPSSRTPSSAGQYHTQNGCRIEVAATATTTPSTPIAIRIFDVISTKSRALPLLAHQVSALPRHPRIVPEIPPINPPVRFDHQGTRPLAIPAALEPPASSSRNDPIFTVPAPIIIRFTSSLVG